MPTDLDEIKKAVLDTQQQILNLDLKVEKIRRKMFWSSLFGTVKVLVVIGTLVWSSWYFQPQIAALYSSMDMMIRSIQTLQRQPTANPNDPAVQQLLEQLKKSNQ